VPRNYDNVPFGELLRLFQHLKGPQLRAFVGAYGKRLQLPPVISALVPSLLTSRREELQQLRNTRQFVLSDDSGLPASALDRAAFYLVNPANSELTANAKPTRILVKSFRSNSADTSGLALLAFDYTAVPTVHNSLQSKERAAYDLTSGIGWYSQSNFEWSQGGFIDDADPDANGTSPPIIYKTDLDHTIYTTPNSILGDFGHIVCHHEGEASKLDHFSEVEGGYLCELLPGWALLALGETVNTRFRCELRFSVINADREVYP